MPSLALAALLATTAFAGDPLRAELDRVAARIEALKAQRMAGRDVGDELDRLLVRSQELAAVLEKRQPRPPRPASAPGPDELRERADALRDEADRVSHGIAALDGKIAAARRAADARAELGPRPPASEVAALVPLPIGPPEPPEPPAVRALVEERSRQARHLADLRAQAERLDAEAAALEHE